MICIKCVSALHSTLNPADLPWAGTPCYGQGGGSGCCCCCRVHVVVAVCEEDHLMVWYADNQGLVLYGR